MAMSTPTAPGTDVLRALVARATLAPSMRNAQPWRWTVHPDHVDLELDVEVARRLEANDERGRELTMSCGAALLTLRVAAAEALLDARVDVLPDPHRPALLAAVTMEPGAIDAAFADLDAVVPLRHTAWSSFDGSPLPAGLAARLAAEAQIEGARLIEVTGADRPDLAALVRRADQERYEDPKRRAEVAEWISSRWSDEGRVVPTFAVVPARVAVRHLDLGDRIADHDAGLLGAAPYVGVLATAGDTPEDWLAAGQALQRVLLVAAADEVLGGFLNAPCQVDAVRARLRDQLPDRPWPQLVLRLGHAVSRPLGTPRRPVDQVVTVQAAPGEPVRRHLDVRPREAVADFTEDTLG
jgi:nitroreductase